MQIPLHATPPVPRRILLHECFHHPFEIRFHVRPQLVLSNLSEVMESALQSGANVAFPNCKCTNGLRKLHSAIFLHNSITPSNRGHRQLEQFLPHRLKPVSGRVSRAAASDLSPPDVVEDADEGFGRRSDGHPGGDRGAWRAGAHDNAMKAGTSPYNHIVGLIRRWKSAKEACNSCQDPEPVSFIDAVPEHFWRVFQCTETHAAQRDELDG